MDGGGRLAQSLTPKRRRGSPRLRKQSSFASSGRAARFSRRWLGPILDRNPPRWFGITAATVLLAGSVAYGVVEGGHAPEIAGEVQDFCDAVANHAGFHISAIALSGEKQLSREQILSLAGITDRSSLLFLDASAVRRRLTSNPWIAGATVLKFYPGRLQIEIKERRAFARWQKDGSVFVISNNGTMLEPYTGAQFAALPLVVGAGAQHAAYGFLSMLALHADIASAVDSSVLVADRRWNLRLKNGIEVRLPEVDAERALDTLTQLDREKKLLSRDIVSVDLRLADRVTVKLSDEAAQAREDALKDAAAKEKKKKKGSDA